MLVIVQKENTSIIFIKQQVIGQNITKSIEPNVSLTTEELKYREQSSKHLRYSNFSLFLYSYSIGKDQECSTTKFSKKGLFRFGTTNWYLLSVLWVIIDFPGKKIAAPQSQEDKVQRIPFVSKQIHLRPSSQPRIFFCYCFLPAMQDKFTLPASKQRKKGRNFD